MPGDISVKHLILSTLVRVFSMRKSPALEYSLFRLITMIKITAYTIYEFVLAIIRIRLG